MNDVLFEAADLLLLGGLWLLLGGDLAVAAFLVIAGVGFGLEWLSKNR